MSLQYQYHREFQYISSILKNIDKRIREETKLPVFITDDPLATVVIGAGKMLDDLDLLKKISII